MPYVVNTVQKLIEKRLPTFGICLGQQILGLALGGKTFKLKFGHRGGNHPVMRLKDRSCAITVQNHGFCVDIDSLDKKEVEITHINLNDGTLEGIRHKKLPVFSVIPPRSVAGAARFVLPVSGIHRFNEINTVPKRTDMKKHTRDRVRPNRHRAGVRV